MLENFIKVFDQNCDNLVAQLAWETPVRHYSELVEKLVRLFDDDQYDSPSCYDIKCNTFGDYTGVQVFLFGNNSCYPTKFWTISVSYGSCSGCDTLQAINDATEYDEPVGIEVAKKYVTLMLHMLQSMKEV